MTGFQNYYEGKASYEGNNPIQTIPSPNPNLPKCFFFLFETSIMKYISISFKLFFSDLAETKDISQKIEDRRQETQSVSKTFTFTSQ